MKICVASDHAGYQAKQDLIGFLLDEGHAVSDCGSHSEESCDYPEYAAIVARAVSEGRCDRGVLVCGTGIGMSIVANRFEGVRAAVVCDDYTTEVSRSHNDANVLSLGARTDTPERLRRIVGIFLKTPFDGGRHRRRLDKIDALREKATRAQIPDPPPFEEKGKGTGDRR